MCCANEFLFLAGGIKIGDGGGFSTILMVGNVCKDGICNPLMPILLSVGVCGGGIQCNDDCVNSVLFTVGPALSVAMLLVPCNDDCGSSEVEDFANSGLYAPGKAVGVILRLVPKTIGSLGSELILAIAAFTLLSDFSLGGGVIVVEPARLLPS